MALDADIIKQKDTYRFEATLENPRTGGTYDLTNASEVRLYVDHLRSDTLVVNSPTEIVDAGSGEVAYEFSRAETARSGTHRAEFVVEETDGSIVTVPSNGYVKLDFTAMLPRDEDVDPVEADADLTVARLNATESVESPSAAFTNASITNLDVDGTPYGESVEDIVGGLLAANGNVSVSYDDAGNTLTIDTSALNTEEVEDAVASLITSDANLTVNYDDANSVITLGLADNVSVTNLDAVSVGVERVKNKRTVHPTNWPGDDLGEQVNNCLAEVGRQNVHIDISGDDDPTDTTEDSGLLLTTPIDLTECRNVHFDYRGATIFASGSMAAAIDVTDSSEMLVSKGTLYGDPADPPDIGILHANANADPDGETTGTSLQEKNRFIGGFITGAWNQAACFHHGREMTVFSGYHLNINDQGYAFAINRYPEIYINGSQQTVQSPTKGALGTGSVVKTWIHDLSAFERQNAGDGCMYIAGDVKHSTMRNVEMRSLGGNPNVIFDLNQDEVFPPTMENVRVRRGLANAQTAVGFKAVNSAAQGGTGTSIRGLVCRGLSALLHDDGETTLSDQPLFTGPSDVDWRELKVLEPRDLEGVTGWENARVNSSLGGCVELQKIDIPSVQSWAGNLRGQDITVSDEAVLSYGADHVEGLNGAGSIRFEVDSGHGLRMVGAGGGGPDRSARSVTVASQSGWDVKIESDATGSILNDVVCEAPDGDALLWNADDCRVVGCHLQGNVTINGSTGVAPGTIITGNVTFNSGASDNDLTGAIIKGTVTDNDGTNTW